MRGSPPLHLLLLLVGFLGIAVALAQLTSGRPPAPVQGSARVQPTDSVAAFLTIRFAHAPTSLSLVASGKTLGQWGPNETSPIETDLALLGFRDSLELAVEARWPDGVSETAVTFIVEPNAMEAREKTVWARGALSTVIPFTWNK